MKIAYLISVYKDPQQFGKLIQALFFEEARFFVHVDKKVSQDIFEESIPVQYRDYVYFTSKRYWIHWGGWNQVLYQKTLLEDCINSNIEFERVFIITGQDYPLISNKDLIEQLKYNPKKEYLIGLDISNCNPIIQEKILLYHFFRDIDGVSYKTKQIFSYCSRIIMKILPFRKKNYLIVDGKKWHVFQSSSYMCITYALAKYVVTNMKNNAIMSYFRYSFVPEELVIPTIIFNSCYRNYASLSENKDYVGLRSLSAITYFNYGKKIQVFSEDNYDELRRCNKFFARKLETGISDSLLLKIDVLRNQQL